MTGVRHTPWSHSEPPTEAAVRAALREEGLEGYRWANSSGDRYPVHTHDYHKVIYCIEGGIWFTLPDEGDRAIEMEPGDRLDLPAGVRHGAIVGMDGVVCLEAHHLP